jgi:hypothetical protein
MPREGKLKTARALAWFAVVAQFVFIGAWITAGALEDGYSHVEHFISELGADGASNPLLMNAGLGLLGLSIAALGPALLATLPHRTSSRVAASLFIGSGVLLALGGVFNLDCSTAVSAACEARWDNGDTDFSTQQALHAWFGFGFEILFLATTFALARALWYTPAAAPALAAGLIGLAIGIATHIGYASESTIDEGGGLIQRAALTTVHIWVVIVAVGILWAARRQPKLPPPTPMRPSEFFGTTWVGEAELVAWPYFFWRRFPQRLRVRRDTTFLSDETWHFDDTIARVDGAVIDTRRIFCTLVAPDRVEVVADELLDRTYIVLEEEGYRIAPYRVAIGVGPVHFGVSVRESATVENGTLVNTYRTSWFGLPIARIEARVRPEIATRSPASS